MTPTTLASTVIPLAALVITLRYVLACAWFPFKAHRKCGGSGRYRGMGGFRLCHSCNGTGRVLRTGRRLHNAFTRVRHDIRVDRRRGDDRPRELGR